MAKGKLGPYRRCPDGWKLRVAAYLDTERGRRSALAKDIGHSKGMITALLKPSAEGGPLASRIAEAVAEWTGIPLPEDALADEEIATLVEDALVMKAMDPKLLAAARQAMRSMREAVERSLNDRPPTPIDPRVGGENRRPRNEVDALLNEALKLRQTDRLAFEAMSWRLHIAARIAARKDRRSRR